MLTPRIVLLVFCIAAIAPTNLWAAEPAPPIKVMSFNIRFGTAKDGEDHWDKRKEMVVATIAAYSPDLLGTQETLAFQRDFLAKHLPTHEFFSAGRDDGKEAGEMAALCWRKDRFKKIAGGHFWLSETPDKLGIKGWDAQLPRVTTWVTLKDLRNPEAKPILYLNTHFDHRGVKARVEAAKLIRKQIAELGKDCSTIVTGDFNAGEGSDPYRAMFGTQDDVESTVVDTFRVAHPKPVAEEITFHSFKGAAVGVGRIDWIGCSRDFSVKSAAIDRTSKAGRFPSDHFPITAEVQR